LYFQYNKIVTFSTYLLCYKEKLWDLTVCFVECMWLFTFLYFVVILYEVPKQVALVHTLKLK